MATEELMEYEYELIDIRIDNGYEQGDEDNGWNACEESRQKEKRSPHK